MLHKRLLILFWLIAGLFTQTVLAEHVPVHQKPRVGEVKVSGGKLFYTSYGIGLPVVVVHGGLGLDHTYLLSQLLPLARHNTLTFYDQRGSGQSLGFDLTASTINMERFVKDLEAVRKQLKYPKMILVGHSWGGLLAMNYAVTYPKHVEKLVLINSVPATSDGFKSFVSEFARRTTSIDSKLKEIQDSKEYKQFDVIAVNKYFETLFQVYFYKPEQINQLTLVITSAAAKSSMQVGKIFDQTYLQNYDLKSKLSKLKMPVLIVHGAQDIIPVATAYELQTFMPKSKLVVLNECDHFSYIEQPQEFFAAVNGFIERSCNAKCRS